MTIRRRKLSTALLVLALSCLTIAQQPSTQTPPPQPASQPTQPSATATPNIALSSDDVILLLTQSVNWYRQNSIEQSITTETSDLTFLADNQRISVEVVQLAFEFARQAEQTAPRPAKPSANAKNKKPDSTPVNAAALAQYQTLVQASQKADQDYQQALADVQTATKNLQAATGKKRTEAEAALATEQSELALRQARRDTLHNMLEFVSASATSGSGFTGLHTQIDALGRSVPSVLSSSPSAPGTSQSDGSLPTMTLNKNQSEPSGLWGLATDLVHLSHKKNVLDQQIAETNDLKDLSKQTRTPLIADLKAALQQADNLSSQPDSTDPTVLAQQKQRFDSLTSQFKTDSSLISPLSKQSILLNLYGKSLNAWKDSLTSQEKDDAKNLLIRLSVLLIIIGAIVVASRLTRRAIKRYVLDSRRRAQFLLLERLCLWFVLGLVLLLTFAAQLNSVATFAGLITAGVALALQNVIVAIVGYFFLIGKFGIRVGDRVQIQDVTGEVVDIGLARLHVMELGGKGTDSQPTGRVVAFSNGIVFQTGGIFKQIPGTSFAWHEITLTFTPDSYYQIIEKSMQDAVNRAYQTYKDKMEYQRRAMERSLSSISAGDILPRVRLRFTTAGIEVTVRFPVILERASEIDDHVMSELLSAIEHEKGLNLVGSEMPTVNPDPAPEPTAPAAPAAKPK